MRHNARHFEKAFVDFHDFLFSTKRSVLRTFFRKNIPRFFRFKGKIGLLKQVSHSCCACNFTADPVYWRHTAEAVAVNTTHHFVHVHVKCYDLSDRRQQEWETGKRRWNMWFGVDFGSDSVRAVIVRCERPGRSLRRRRPLIRAGRRGCTAILASDSSASTRRTISRRSAPA